MARYVIDAVTLLHLIDHGIEVDPSHQLVAPNAIRTQALELLLVEVRAGARTERDALAIHERVTETKMRLLGDRVSRGTAWKFAMTHGWETLREAEYIAVARLQADALVTVDPQMAAMAELEVPVAPLSILSVSG